MLERMLTVEDRFEEIDRLMADPDVVVDYIRVEKLAREQAQLKGVVGLSRGLRSLESEIEGLRTMLHDEGDEEMAELAREELSQLEAQRVQMELDLKLALVPKDQTTTRT